MKIKSIIYVLIVGLFVFSSCKSKKNVIESTTDFASENALVHEVITSQPNFITANVTRMNMNISTGEKEFSSAGACKIYRDSVIQLSIQPFMGIELFRLELTPEAVYLFDKTSNKYYHMIYEQLSDLLGVPLTFYDFQSLISNQLFCLGSADNGNFDKIHASKKNGNILLTYDTPKVKQTTLYQKPYIKNVVISGKKDDFKFVTNYDKYQVTNDVNAPGIIDMQFNNKDRNMTLSFTISKVEFNKEMRVILTNPLRYTPASFESFLNNPIF